MHTFLKGKLRYVRCKQPSPGFELESNILFPTIITMITTGAPDAYTL